MSITALRLLPLQRRVLAIAVRGGPLPRAELARRVGASRSRISPEIARMIDAGILVQQGLEASHGGRRSALLSPGGVEVGVLAGIDIDAGGISVAVTTLAGDVVGREDQQISSDPEPEATVERAGEMLDRCLRPGWGPLLAIGVSVPADIDPGSGLIESAPTLPRWLRFPVAGQVADRFAVRVFVDNDVNVLALAEASRPGASERIGRDFLVVKVSSGVGCGVVVDGVVFRGSRGFAGDIGHISVDPSDPTLCACGNHGCLEALAAAPAIVRDAETLRERPDCALRDLVADAESVTLEAISRAAQSGDAHVAGLLRVAGGHIGFVLAGIVSFFNPSAVIVRTGIPGGDDILLNAIRQRVYERALSASTRDLRVLPTGVAEHDSAMAAATLAGQGFLGTAGSVAEARPSRRAVADRAAARRSSG